MFLIDIINISPEQVWGIFPRLLGLVFLIAFSQLFPQMYALGGENGINPISDKLKAIKTDFPGLKKYILFPGVQWLGSKNIHLTFYALAGCLSSAYIIVGGPYTSIAFLLCWFLYLSFDLVAGLSYPWDSLLLEAGFLCVFLPSLNFIGDNFLISELPHPAISFLIRLLLFRVIFGFGKFKFIGSSLHDIGYFKAFLTNIPLGTRLTLWVNQFPLKFFYVFSIITFLVEIVSPFFIFIPNELRLIPFFSIILLMIGIQVLSNFGFFNLLTIVCCIPLLDIHSSIFDLNSTYIIGTTHNLLLFIVALILFIFGMVNFPFNTWCSFTWPYWPSALQLKGAVPKFLVSSIRFFSKLRISHSYGVFPKKAGPPFKPVLLIKGSNDGIEWKTYNYKYLPSSEDTPMPWLAPYHPRLDHALFYEPIGVNDSDYLWSALGANRPHDFCRYSGTEIILQRILEGNKTVLKLFRNNPFDSAPKYVKADIYRAKLNPLNIALKTGKNYSIEFVENQIPQRQLNPDFHKIRKVTPALYHWDAYFWRIETEEFKTLKKIAKNADLNETIQYINSLSDISVAELYEFINQLDINNSFDTIPSIYNQFVNDSSELKLVQLESVWNRLNFALAERLMPFYLNAKKVNFPYDNFFIYGLFIQFISGKGFDTYAELFNNPNLWEKIEGFDQNKAFYYNSVFRYPTVLNHSRKFLWTAITRGNEVQDIVPGFSRLGDFLKDQFKDLRNPLWPELSKDPKSGEWIVKEKY